MAPSGRLVGQPRPAAPPPAPPGRYVGRYASAYFGEVVVAGTQGALALTLGRSGQRYVLEPWAADVFTLSALGEIATEGSISTVSFDIAADNRASAVTIEFLDADGLGTFRR